MVMGSMTRRSFVFFVIFLCFTCGPLGSSGYEFTDQQDSLKIPASEFASAVKTTIDVVQQVISIVSGISKAFGDFRLVHAISDCVDLLELSAAQLTTTLSVTQNPKTAKDNSTGNLIADMKTWLSGALINQETCAEGFEGTNSLAESLVAGGLSQISNLVSQILGNVRQNPAQKVSDAGGHGGGGRGPAWMKKRKLVSEKFPDWVKPDDRRLLLQVNGVEAHLVVAADGSGNFTTVSQAVEAVPDYGPRTVIYVKKGVYREYVDISKKKWNIMMVGDGMDVTVISGNHNYIDGWTTYSSATFGVKGQGFIARDMTFENTAGPAKHQAVAFRTDSDLSVYYRCAFRGYQDTLYAHSQRQFYRECHITGTVDFIFGDASAVFQSCQIFARQGLPNQKNTVTAQGRKEIEEPTGFTIQFSNITVEPNVNVNTTPTYLGRPWKLYSRTVVMQSLISNAIRPEGWLAWNETFAFNTLYYGEYMNYGPGAGLGGRVKWPGFHPLNASQANTFTVANFILGNSWLPPTGVKYTAGLEV